MGSRKSGNGLQCRDPHIGRYFLPALALAARLPALRSAGTRRSSLSPLCAARMQLLLRAWSAGRRMQHPTRP